MDYGDGFVLNIAEDATTIPRNASAFKKSGRWTDRARAKRVFKRKVPQDDSNNDPAAVERPVKRPRIEHRKETQNAAPSMTASTSITTSKPTHIISSLFTSNPKVLLTTPEPTLISQKPVNPSNAPLTDSSTFAGLGLDPLIISHLTNKMGIDKPTSIQRSALLPLLSALPEHSSRDVFIQSQTGSGKTLSFLLPIIQDLLPLSTHSYIDRSIGTLAVILAPTRELAKQISDVLEHLLKLRLRLENESAEDSAQSLTRWLVSGLLTGGNTRAHEKARLRKGVPILVATPGRLLDHLQNTSSLNIGKCRWLVLDEADRLMELGFEETITGIIRGLDGRRKLAMHATEGGNTVDVSWDWERRRRTILCSASIREDVQKLAGTTLTNPLMIKATESDRPLATSSTEDTTSSTETRLTPPSQLSQKYIVVPLKLRLVALVALLRTLLSQAKFQSGSKIIVFLSCTDSVDFHWSVLGGASMEDSPVEEPDSSDDEHSQTAVVNSNPEKVEVKSPLLPGVSIFRLHGSLPTTARLAALKGFIGKKQKSKSESAADIPLSSILLCTSVASRGLDLPLVRAVVQCDLPTEGGAVEYVHRVGRTARAGKGGEAWSFVAPSEADWIKWMEGKMNSDEDGSRKVSLSGVTVESVLSSGFGGKGVQYEQRATDVQLSFERWVLSQKSNAELAKNAYLSHMRAYATHPSDEKHMFHLRNLHIGHLAKAFALRDAPKTVSRAHGKQVPTLAKKKGSANKTKGPSKAGRHRADEDEDDYRTGDAERRMKEMVRKQGRLSKKGGVMMSAGTSEFQIAGTDALEKMVGQA